MRKLFVFNMVTLDGFFEGPNHDISWHNVDEEFNQFAIAQLDEIGALLFGRITYQLMSSYWPTEMAKQDDPVVAEKMNNIPKVVVSTTLEQADWSNSRLIRERVVDQIAQLKEQPGKALAIFGSSDLMVSLIPDGLIDEFRIMVNPVVLGSGRGLFQGLQDKLRLRLAGEQTFNSGNVLLRYVTEGK